MHITENRRTSITRLISGISAVIEIIRMLVLKFRIWFRYLLIVLVVMLGIELCLFMPKEQVVREIETVDEQTGGLVTVDLDTRQITVYRRGLILPRYFPQERLQMKPDKEIERPHSRIGIHFTLSKSIQRGKSELLICGEALTASGIPWRSAIFYPILLNGEP